MKAVLFYDVARRLYADLDKLSPDEGLVRTIISRAYYAVLLVLCDMAGISTRGRGGHKMVRNHYRKMGGVCARISGRMEDLMDLRIKAGYKMDERLTVQDAKRSLELCEAILEDVTKVP